MSAVEFIAECRLDRQARRNRPANVPGLLAALAALGLFAASAPIGLEFARSTQDMLQQSARSGFSPENAQEVRQLVTIAVRVLVGTFVVSSVSVAVWLVLKDLAKQLGRAAYPGWSEAIRRGEMTVRLTEGAAEMSDSVSHVSAQWPLVASASLKRGNLVLELHNGAVWTIPATTAPGGPEAALEHVRGALEGAR